MLAKALKDVLQRVEAWPPEAQAEAVQSLLNIEAKHTKGKSAVAADQLLTKAQAKEAMARFESLTRQLLTVPRGRLQAEQPTTREPKTIKSL